MTAFLAGPIVDLVGQQDIADGLDFFVGVMGPRGKIGLQHDVLCSPVKKVKRCAQTGRVRAGVPTATMASGTSRITRSEEHTSELQSLMRISYAVFCLKKKKKQQSSRPFTATVHT